MLNKLEFKKTLDIDRSVIEGLPGKKPYSE